MNDDHLWTLERSGPDLVQVILTTGGEIQAAYVNGKSVSHDNALVVTLVDGWDPPRRWLPPMGQTDEAALYNKALTSEQVAAHYSAFSGGTP